ncbi:substrate-binding periplasmic protein [Flocculibacter collagenilyticus]|uniref:substrate-binding periplasmic protein n=1 Tax=Flocculibacter collagenilyticus TaxID=2744479 RepID=UPI0018F6ACA5|nr:transporter substrate-binding domain-containing protein [Flocculibacter collagenilyticus]
MLQSFFNTFIHITFKQLLAWLVLPLFILLVLANKVRAHHDITIDNITPASTPHITVVTEIWPPYNYIDENGEVVGIATDVIRQTLEHAKLDYHIEPYPWVRAYNMAQEEENVLIYSIIRTPERKDLFQWICQITPYVKHHFYRLTKRTDIQAQNLEDVKAYKVGVVKNTYPHTYLKGVGFVDNTNLEVVVDDEANIRKLFAGRLDLLIETPETMTIRLSKMGLKLDEVTPFLTINNQETFENCMAFGLKTDPALVKKVRDAFEQTKHLSKLKRKGSSDPLLEEKKGTN